MQLIEAIPADQPPVPLLLTAPHSGELIPREATWLQDLPKPLLLTDVDRFVDRLYEPAARKLAIPLVLTRVHRYAADLNRYPEDVDQDSVTGAPAPSGSHPKGFHWVVTTQGDSIMKAPISAETHAALVRLYHDAFHAKVKEQIGALRGPFPHGPLFHLDCHSMPSTGTGAHRDQGEKRADVVISDQEGKSASSEFLDLVQELFRKEGFVVAYNWPYLGGRITQRYGRPDADHHTLQIELNRNLYMDEKTREAKQEAFEGLQKALERILAATVSGIRALRS